MWVTSDENCLLLPCPSIKVGRDPIENRIRLTNSTDFTADLLYQMPAKPFCTFVNELFEHRRRTKISPPIKVHFMKFEEGAYTTCQLSSVCRQTFLYVEASDFRQTLLRKRITDTQPSSPNTKAYFRDATAKHWNLGLIVWRFSAGDLIPVQGHRKLSLLLANLQHWEASHMNTSL